MRIYSAIIFVMLFGLVVGASACQSATPSPTPTLIENEVVEKQATDIPVEEPAQEPVDEPASQDTVAYPSPIEIVQYDPYPSPVDGEIVEWDQVESIIKSGEVVKVFQAFSLSVTLTLKDGHIYITEEPAKDAIFVLIEQCGEPCYNIQKVTE